MHQQIDSVRINRFREACQSLHHQLNECVPPDKIQRADTPGKKRYIAGTFVDGSLALQLIVSMDETTYEINVMIRSVDGDFATQDAALVVLRNFRNEECRVVHKCGPDKDDLIRSITRSLQLGDSTFPRGADMKPDIWRNFVAVMLTAFDD